MSRQDPTPEDHESGGTNRFADVDIDRRDFVRLSAATGAALALPGNASASARSGKFDAEYQYALNHTPADHAVPTLVEFTDASGLDAFEAVAGETITTTEPGVYAYGQLTTAEAEQAADIPSASTFQFAPGSNPFWRIGYYPLGVFPEAQRAVDFIGFEQLKDGLDELESRYPERVRIKQMAGDGQSPGHLNNVTGRDDPKDMLLAEVTNFDSETTFEEKEKIFYSCSLHGLERAGAEAGARIIENIARGDQFARGPDETKQSVTELLDDAVLIFGFTNPDGWAVRNPQYDSGWQTNGPGATSVGGVTAPRAPAAPLYERGNAEIYDTNRQYPVVGSILPIHYPGDPETIKDNERGRITKDNVPDAFAIVEHFREYENLNYGADLHGGPVFNNFVLGLISQDQYDTRELHETYEMCRVIDEVLEDELEVWATAGDIRTSTPLGDEQYDPVLFGILPDEAFDYAGIFDTINYNVSGAMLDWMAHPEEFGGLGMTTLDFEMAFSHMTGGNVYNPALLDMEVRGYRTAIRTIARFAVENSRTPNTEDQFSATTKTRFSEDEPQQKVAYVTAGDVGTGADPLERNSGDLDFDGDGVADGPEPSTTVSQATVSEAVGAGETVTTTFTVEESDLHSLYAHPHAHQAFFDLRLVDPDGDVAADYEAVGEDRAGGMCCGHPEFVVNEPASGEWTLEITNVGEDLQATEVQFATMAVAGQNPDPVPAVGYDQKAYSVTPFRFFEDYADSIENDDGVVEPVTVQEIAESYEAGSDDDTGSVLDGYQHVVVIHDYGANGDADYIGKSDGPVGYRPASSPTPGVTEDGYVDALDDFVDKGGNLVLTDMGVNLLEKLDNDLVGSGQFDGAITTNEYVLGRVKSKSLDDRLMTDVREIQGQLMKSPPLGYTPGFAGDAIGELPMRLPDQSAFTSTPDGAKAAVAGTTDGGVSVGRIFEEGSNGERGVQVISSLLPPATQKNLHPFGMVNYAPSFFGYLLLTSALGFQQVRRTASNPDGKTYGAGHTPRETDDGDDEEEEEEEEDETKQTKFTASGSRSDDGAVYTAGQTVEVQITVDSLSHRARITDNLPESWDVKEEFGAEPTVRSDEDGDGTQEVVLETVPASAAKSGNDEKSVTLSYFAEAPSSTGQYTFGPAQAEAVNTSKTKNDEAQVAGTETNNVVGVEQP